MSFAMLRLFLALFAVAGASAFAVPPDEQLMGVRGMNFPSMAPLNPPELTVCVSALCVNLFDFPRSM